MITLKWQKMRRNQKAFWWEWKAEWRSWLKTLHSKNQDHGIWSHHFMANKREGKWKQWQILFSWAPKSLQMVTAAMKLKGTLKEGYDKPRQHIKKQRHNFADKDPSSQSYGFSSSHVQMWELDYKEGWVLKNWCFLNYGVGEDFSESLGLKGDPTSSS